MKRMILLIIFWLVTLMAMFAMIGCERTMVRTQDPRQEMSVNPVRLDSGLVDIVIKYKVTNVDKEPVSYKFNSAKQWDAWVIYDGKEIFRESAGKVYAQSETTFTLQPGETKEFESTWQLSKDAQKYKAGAKFEIFGGLLTKGWTPLKLEAVPVI